jgi:hypothetical protein
MSYVVPDGDAIRERFPEITKTDEVLDPLIEEAQLYVDDTWIESDFDIAISLLVAHWCVTGTGAAAGQGVIQSESFGPMSRTFASGIVKGKGAVADLLGLASTSYGRRFSALLRRNGFGIAVI